MLLGRLDFEKKAISSDSNVCAKVLKDSVNGPPTSETLCPSWTCPKCPDGKFHAENCSQCNPPYILLPHSGILVIYQALPYASVLLTYVLPWRPSHEAK